MLNNNDVKKLRTIRLLAFIECGVIVFSLILLICFISLFVATFDPLSVLIISPVYLLGFSCFVLNIANGILILSTKWSNNEVENQKVLWGVLTFVLLGWIASLVFSIQAIKKYNNNSNNQNNYSNNDNLANF